MTTDKSLVKSGEFDLDFGMPDMMTMMMMVMMMAILMSVISSTSALGATTTQALQAQSYEGLTVSKTLRATAVLQWINLISDPPYTPWITAYFFNNGPSSVLIGTNNPDELTLLEVGEDKSVDMTGATRRIELIFYKSYPGVEAIVRVEGKY